MERVTVVPSVRQVLHLLPVDAVRGAQTHARLLRTALDRPDQRHRTLTLFDAPSGSLQADDTLGVANGALRRAGFDPRVAYRLWRRLHRDRPDVIIVHGGEPLRYAALVRRRRTRLVYHRIGVLHERVRQPVRRVFYRWSVRRCDVVVGVSEDTLDDVVRILGVERARLRLIVNGRDPTRFAPSTDDTRADGAGGRPRLLWIGHLTSGKRPRWFLDTVAALRSSGLDVDASIVGDGPLEDALAREAPQSGVELLGRRDDVPDLLRACDVVCFTSTGEGEGLPGVLIEAGLSGRPVVTTRVAGASTVVDDGVTGDIVEVDDFDAYVRAVRRLVSDASLATRMGRAARARCVERFTLETSVAEWRRLLDDLLAR